VREIKFRGKCSQSKRWVYGYYFIEERDIEDGIIWRDIPQIQQRYGDHFQYFDVDPATIGQYTGLKDKNGTEIYEGDVCTVWIEFCKQIKPYVVEDLRKLYLETERDDSYYRITSLQVIGNIHDNPELLGGAE
jgi:uncharacterized phage protein (TIGR01671 family)